MIALLVAALAQAADVESAKAVRSLVGMIRPLGITIVAKGVDTPEQLAAVLALNCDSAQGDMISQPAPANELEFVRRSIDTPETHAPETHAPEARAVAL